MPTTVFPSLPLLNLGCLGVVKRAETRQCPVCSEHIPVRLLEAHCNLETQRTEEVIRAVGSLEVYGDSVDGYEPHPSHMPPLPIYTPPCAELSSPGSGAPPLEPRKPSRDPALGWVPLPRTPPLERKG